MTPQSGFMLVAPVAAGREAELRALLASMNRRPGVVEPQNSHVPFGRLDRLHFSRFTILDDLTVDDVTQHGLPRVDYGPSLAFLADFDGPVDAFLADLLRHADQGLRRIFAHCEGFAPDGDLLGWMRAHAHRPAASYVNWRGRTTRQIREEAALRDALVAHLRANAAAVTAMAPSRARETLVTFVKREQQAGRLPLTAEQATPLGWWLRNAAHAVFVPLVGLLLLPLLLLYLPIFLIQLRRRERRDPEVLPRPDPAHVRKLADLEDHDVTNQFGALGTAKPGLFRTATLRVGLLGLDYAARHVYKRGHLTRVSTIHFARWVYLDGKRRILFASNYDGSLESYMDDFINKVGWGLNLVFSNGVGYPRTDFLVKGGAWDEQKFKRYIRRHELATEVWYNAHPGLTAVDLARNTKIRRGVEEASTTDAQARAWLQLL
ncbi:MAG: hypothetical protein ACRELZ_00395 [Candidatus Rokuibacteriota bacterium]